MAPTLLTQPSTTPPGTEGPAGRSRRRRLATIVAVIGGLGAAGGGLWWHAAVTSNPLVFVGAAGNVFSAARDKTGIVDVGNYVGSEATVDHVPGGGFSAFMSLRNHSGHDVRIERFEPTSFYYWGLDQVHVAATDDTDGNAPKGDRPFAAFTLPAGESRRLRADFRFADCGPAARFELGHSTITSLPVKYRLLGFARTVDVPFDDAAITSQTLVGDCTHPVPEPADH